MSELLKALLSRKVTRMCLHGILLAIGIHLLASSVVAQSTIRTYAGGDIPAGGATALTQNIVSPGSVTSDGAGGFFFASNSTIFRVDAAGTLTRVAGKRVPGSSGDDGPAISAQFSDSLRLALDSNGSILIADYWDHRIRRITPDGIMRTVAGTGGPCCSEGDGGPATSAAVGYPKSLAVDRNGYIFTVDSRGNLRYVNPDGMIYTRATGQNGVTGLAVDGSGDLFISFSSKHQIIRNSPTGATTVIAGNGSQGFSGDGGPATSASLTSPADVVLDGSGNLFIADGGAHRVRKIDTNGIISTVAGNGTTGFSGDGGPATSATLGGSFSIAVDTTGSLIIADRENNRVRKVDSAGTIRTVAGTGQGDLESGPATLARLTAPTAVAVAADGSLVIADSTIFFNETLRTAYGVAIRKVTPDGMIQTLHPNSDFRGTSVTSDRYGNLFLAGTDDGDGSGSGSMLKSGPDGVVRSFGSFYFFDYDGLVPRGEICVAGIAVDADGNVFVAVTITNSIWKIAPDGVVTRIIGGSFGSSPIGDGGPASAASLSLPNGLAIDGNGNLYIADSYHHRIRKVTPDGKITTVAGSGAAGFGGDGGPATSAKLWYPLGVAVGIDGNLYIADSHNNRIRKVDSSGIITTFAGNGTPGFSGDEGPPTDAQLDYPSGVAVDDEGNVFIADLKNSRIREVTPPEPIVLPVPVLSGIVQSVGVPGTTIDVTLAGSGFFRPLTLNPGPDIAVSDLFVVSKTTAIARLTIGSNAVIGPRDMTVTTKGGTSASAAFAVVPPFPDLTITTSVIGKLGAGHTGRYTLDIRNIGTTVTMGAITVRDDLPEGLTFISSVGNDWSCSAAGQAVTCQNSQPLAAGSSTSLTITVNVQSTASPSSPHRVSVSTNGDQNSSNDSPSQTIYVSPLPAPQLGFGFLTPTAGTQNWAVIGTSTPFPFDVTGKLTMVFSSTAAVPLDDPAIQFETGGREVAFTIPANSLQAQFAGAAQSSRIRFQPGTVAGAIGFTAAMQSGDIPIFISSNLTMKGAAPAIQKLQTTSDNGFAALITLLSTTREVASLSLQFSTSPPVQLSCGNISGCTVKDSTLTFDVSKLFQSWFASDKTYGSLSMLRLPLTIQAVTHGWVSVKFRNSMGESSSMAFPLP